MFRDGVLLISKDLGRKAKLIGLLQIQLLSFESLFHLLGHRSHTKFLYFAANVEKFVLESATRSRRFSIHNLFG